MVSLSCLLIVLYEQRCGLQPHVYSLIVQREKTHLLLQVMKYEEPLNWKQINALENIALQS